MAMSVCDPDGGMHRIWDGVLPRQVFAGLPPAGFDAGLDEAYADELRRLIEVNAGELAAVIVEPVVQGAGGMRFHDPGYLRVLRDACDDCGVLLVFDEIATGFGRTGTFFAAEHAGVSPDVMCVGKALTGGYLTLAAALCSPEVASGIARGELPVLAHGPTFMGNPLACAVAGASLDVLLGRQTYPQGWQPEVARIAAGLRAGLAPAAGLPGVADVRVLGAIGVVQLDREVDVAAATRAAVDAGVWLRPFRDLIYTMPPYVTGDDDVAAICSGVLAAVTAATASAAGAAPPQRRQLAAVRRPVRRQVEPDRGAGRVPQVAPLRGELLYQVQAVAVGGQQVVLDDRGAGRAVVDDLDEHAVGHVDHDDGDGAARRPGRSMQDRVRDQLRCE